MTFNTAYTIVLFLTAITLFMTATLMVTAPIQRKVVDTAYTIREFLYAAVLLGAVAARTIHDSEVFNIARLVVLGAMFLASLVCLGGIIYLAKKHGVITLFRRRRPIPPVEVTQPPYDKHLRQPNQLPRKRIIRRESGGTGES